MGVSAIVGGIAAAASVGGTVTSMIGQEEAAASQKKAEQIKQTQMNLDASRQRRDIARRALVTQSNALASATADGAQDGSGFAGASAQITGQAGEATEAVNQNQLLGTALFNQNQQTTSDQSLAATGMGISGLASSLNQNKDMLGRVGSYIGSQITGPNSWI